MGVSGFITAKAVFRWNCHLFHPCYLLIVVYNRRILVLIGLMKGLTLDKTTEPKTEGSLQFCVWFFIVICWKCHLFNWYEVYVLILRKRSLGQGNGCVILFTGGEGGWILLLQAGGTHPTGMYSGMYCIVWGICTLSTHALISSKTVIRRDTTMTMTENSWLNCSICWTLTLRQISQKVSFKPSGLRDCQNYSLNVKVFSDDRIIRHSYT